VYFLRKKQKPTVSCGVSFRNMTAETQAVAMNFNAANMSCYFTGSLETQDPSRVTKYINEFRAENRNQDVGFTSLGYN